jgi:hypothetical protein
MSAPAVAIAAVKKPSVFKRVEAFFKKAFGSTSWEKTVSATLTYTAPVLETVVALTAGEPAAALITGIVREVQTDMAVVAVTVDDAQSPAGTTAPASAVNVLGSIKTNLASILAGGHIEDPKTLTAVTGVVDKVIGEVDAMLENAPTK